ncbi:MAG: Thioredoxin domain [Myxococcaceae bacterium]|nr:Thioredoxin domain [Myxococcaceae bacterium]
MDPKPAVEPVKEKQAVKQLVEKDYETEVLKATEPVVVDFYSADSAPCAALAPRFGAVAEKFEGKIRFYKILRGENDALAKQLKVTVSPTLIFFKGGQELGERLSGDDIKRTALKASVEALLK